MTKAKVIRRRRAMVPYFLLCLLMYGTHKSVERNGLHRRIKTEKFSRSISIDGWVIRKRLQWLVANGYASDYKEERGWCEITLRDPLPRQTMQETT